MKYRREDVIKQMSEVFSSIPDIVIGDVFDSIVSENIALCKKKDGNSNSNKYSDDIINAYDKLFEKLLEITSLDNDSDSNVHTDNSDDFSGAIYTGNTSYLSICLKNNDKKVNTGKSYSSNKIKDDLIDKLKKRPWDLNYIENNIVSDEMVIFRNYLNKIFNSDKLYKVKECSNKLWPPEGPGFESEFIPLKAMNYSNINNACNASIDKLLNELNNTKDSINELRIQYRKMINNTSINEYKLIKSKELNEHLKKLMLKKEKIENCYYNEIFNIQNVHFIDGILDSKLSKHKHILVDLHNYNRNKALNIVIFCIVMILKFKLDVDFNESFFRFKDNKKELINNEELYNSQKNFKGNYVDLYICVGLGNHNSINSNIEQPKLASLIRRLSYALNLLWRFGINGVIILRIQDNIDWYKYINQILDDA